MNYYNIHKAEPEDLDMIFDFIHKLASYEKRPQDAVLTKQSLKKWLFDQHIAEVQLLNIDNKYIGYALYYPVFASFTSEAHIHLEDMYIDEEYRNKGAGRFFLQNLVSLLLSKGYTGMEWSALDWNENACRFYRHMGALQEKGRFYFSLDQHHMNLLAQQNEQINRIISMESAMDRLMESLHTGSMSEKDYEILSSYYEQQWLEDFEADERKEIPSFIKRGVLSEDTLYNLLHEIEQKKNPE